MSLGTILLIILIVILLAGIPRWFQGDAVGYGGGVGLLLIIVLVLVIKGRI